MNDWIIYVYAHTTHTHNTHTQIYIARDINIPFISYNSGWIHAESTASRPSK